MLTLELKKLIVNYLNLCKICTFSSESWQKNKDIIRIPDSPCLVNISFVDVHWKSKHLFGNPIKIVITFLILFHKNNIILCGHKKFFCNTHDTQTDIVKILIYNLPGQDL